MGEIKITLETLYDILRNEKKREDLQKLDASFFVDVVAYLREKQSLLDSKVNATDLFAVGEKEKLEYELRSIKRILKQIYESREKKIIDICLNKSRTGSDIIDTTSMLRIENDFYHNTLKILDTYRRGILLQLFRGELPDIVQSSTTLTPATSMISNPISPHLNSSISKPTLFTKKTEQVLSSAKFEESSKKSNENKTLKSNENKTLKSNENKTLHLTMVKIKFLHPVPSFVWKDMKEYGPYAPGENTEIFPEVADLLVRKGRAEKV